MTHQQPVVLNVTHTLTYAGQRIRVMMLDQPWFVAADIAKAVGVVSGHHLVRRVPSSDRRYARTPAFMYWNLVNPRGVRRVLARSRKPLARAFLRWAEETMVSAVLQDTAAPVALRLYDQMVSARELWAGLGNTVNFTGWIHSNVLSHRLYSPEMERTPQYKHTPTDYLLTLDLAASIAQRVTNEKGEQHYQYLHYLRQLMQKASEPSDTPALTPKQTQPAGAPVSLQLHEHADGTVMVSARELWVGLGSKREFTAWAQHNITSNPLLIEGVEYAPHCGGYSQRGRGRPKTDYRITLDLAKHITLQSRTEIGRQYRQYLIEVEKRVTDDTRAVALTESPATAPDTIHQRLAALETVVMRLLAS